MDKTNEIERALQNLICKTCNNLSYWDGYYCKSGKHKTKSDKLSKKALKHCSEYKLRVGTTWNACKKQQECVFWCKECPALDNGKKDNS